MFANRGIQEKMPSAVIVIEFLPPYTMFHVIPVSSYRDGTEGRPVKWQ